MTINQESPRVLILLPTSDGALHLKEQIDSIISQRDVFVQILARDNLSKDNSRKILESYKNNLDLIPVDHRTKSAGESFRDLIRQAKVENFDYIAYADSDDIWLPDKLSRAISSLSASGASGYSSSVCAFWPQGRKRILRQSPKIRRYDFLFEGSGQGCTFVIPIESFLDVQEFCLRHKDLSETMAQHDWMTYLIIRKKSSNWFFDQDFSMFYRQHGSNELGARGTWPSILRRINLLRNGWYRNQIESAFKIYSTLDSHNPEIDKLSRVLYPQSILGRFRLAFFMLVYSRRKLFDRYICVGASLIGWI